VIGREERTNAEQAQYRFLLHSLTVTRHPPLFVDIIWFPRNTQRINRGEQITDPPWVQSFQVLRNINNSQREVLRAMVSTDPRDSLVIAHGMLVLLQRSFTQTNADVTAQGLLEQGKQPRLPPQRRYGYFMNYLAG
jgi:hypothetical protein